MADIARMALIAAAIVATDFAPTVQHADPEPRTLADVARHRGRAGAGG